jgi:hypothetical protein
VVYLINAKGVLVLLVHVTGQHSVFGIPEIEWVLGILVFIFVNLTNYFAPEEKPA